MNNKTIFLSLLLSLPLLMAANELDDILFKKLNGIVEHVLAIKQEYIEIYYATLRLPNPTGRHYLNSPLITTYLYIGGPNKGECKATLSRWGTEENFEKPFLAFVKIRTLFQKQEAASRKDF